MPERTRTLKGFKCPACVGVRLAVVKQIETEDGITHVGVCTACQFTAPLSADDTPGLACPKCGNTHLPALYTKTRPGMKTRRRRCRQCHHRVTTVEVMVDGAR